MAQQTLLAKTTSASTATTFTVDKRPVRVSVYPVASLTAAEYCDLQLKDADGTYGDVYDHAFKGSGGQVRLDTTVTSILIDAPGEYRIDKEASTNAIGLTMDSA